MLTKNARHWISLALVSFSLAGAPGCIETHQLPSVVPADGASTSALVTAAGADLAIGDLHVVVPAGAVTADTMITVRVESSHLPFTPYSSLVRVEPAGLALAQPLELRIPFRGDAARATAYVADAGGRAFSPRATEIFGDVAVTRMTTLSAAFVGTACEGASCTCEPIGMLDLLVVVDDSTSMQEEQALLRDQLPRLFRSLATGDLDGDGAQDVPAFDDVRVGITSTDLGLGSVMGVPSCNPGVGDGGVLLSSRGIAADPSCTTSTYASAWASYDASMPAGLDGFVSQIACTSALGAHGCGLEQPLAASVIALSPHMPTSYTALGWAPPTLASGYAPEGDDANAGFVRDGSILAVVYLTDEDDTSIANDEAFSPSDPTYSSVELNVRGIAFPELLLPVDDIASSLAHLRPRPEDLVVGAIAGIPAGMATSDTTAVLAAPGMTPTLDPTQPDRLESVCSSMHGTAAPAQRIVQTLDGLSHDGSRVVLQSICDDSFDSFTDALAHALAARAGGSC